ncbi:MAG: hypothetical protein ACREUQ_09740, partial [Burkholderiales bacterium]
IRLRQALADRLGAQRISAVPSPLNRENSKLAAIAIASWATLAAVLLSAGVFRPTPGEPSIAFPAAVIAPLAIFVILYQVVSRFRSFVLGLDTRLITIMQSWRVLGLMFIQLYWLGLLPGLFAYPAGLGDAAIGISAPLVALALIANPARVAARGFVLWNLLGILDFVVALTAGTLMSGTWPHFVADGPSTRLMREFPLGMIPTFLVPLFAMLHLSAIFHARAARRSRGAR